MAELLKDVYNESFIEGFSRRLCEIDASFPTERFARLVFAEGWDDLALKQRMRRISAVLREVLPAAYRDALAILLQASEGCRGLPYLLFPDFVEQYGLDDPDASIPALAVFTRSSSSEFAVRPFIVAYPERMLAQLTQWAEDSDEHLRRLSSEGCRPRLPWASPLTAFKADPSPVLAILDRLKEDPSEYVRKSVANNLNDISKDHPERILALAARWLGHHPHTDWIVRHGSRSLLKQCNPEALHLFGLSPDEQLSVEALAIADDRIPIGGVLSASFRLLNNGSETKRIRIEYAVDFLKANGRHSRKLFKLSERDYPPGPTGLNVKHRLAQLTTRKHYPGEHRLAIIANGIQLADADFIVLPEEDRA